MFQLFKNYRKESTALTAVVFLNWVIGFVDKWLFRLVAIVFLGMLFSFWAHTWFPEKTLVTLVKMSMSITPVFLMLIIAFYLIESFLKEWFSITQVLSSTIYFMMKFVILMASLRLSPSEQLLVSMLEVWLIFGVIHLLIKFLSPKIFQAYLFKKVLNRSYLGIRKSTDSNIPETNIFKDAAIENIDDRLRTISKHAIKNDYQKFVECSFLLKKESTKIVGVYNILSHQKFRKFEKDNLILTPIFYVYPFEKDELNYKLLSLSLSEYEKADVNPEWRLNSIGLAKINGRK
ncbi:hypothetical protein ACVR1G_08275 [Streptococcus dentasini]